AQQGNFTYLGTDGVKRTVNVLDVARNANQGFTSTVDPTIAGILSKINATQSGASGFVPISGVASEFLTNMQWTHPQSTSQAFPTLRLDYQIKPTLAWHGTMNLRDSNFTYGVEQYPGSP